MTRRILVSGSTGLVGTALIADLKQAGYDITRLVRHHGHFNDLEIGWDPNHGVNHPDQLEGFDAVFHLAGENIAAGRWTEERKERIYASRVTAPGYWRMH